MSSAKRLDDNKVFDVSKPGKGKIVATSRPVITSQEIAKDPDIVEQSVPVKSPSASHKVIQPITINTPDESKPELPIEIAADDESETPKENVAAEPVHEEAPEPVDEVTVTDVPSTAPKEAIDSAPAETSSQQLQDSPPKEMEEPVSSEAATVEAVMNAAGTKKQAVKEAEEQAKRDAAVQELIDSKKYYVKLGHDTHSNSSSHKWVLVALVLIFTGLIGSYLAIDAELVQTGITLPYELIKN